MTTQQDGVAIDLLGDTELTQLFHEVAASVSRKPSEVDNGDREITNEEKLRLYGLYKRANDGELSSSKIPSLIYPVARAKILAWKECSSMTERDAMLEYIRLVALRQDNIGENCRCVINNCYEKHTIAATTSISLTQEVHGKRKLRMTSDKKVDESTSEEGIGRKCIGQQISGTHNVISPPIDEIRIGSTCGAIAEMIGVRPLVPRGRLDISYGDLAFGLYQSAMQSDTKQEYDRLQGEIAHLWATSSNSSMRKAKESIEISEAASKIIVGLSVRSLFDLYLTMKGYSDGSEVLVVPPISVPGMMHVARYHNLRIVPVDIDLRREENDYRNSKEDTGNQWINLKELQSKVTEKTIAILIVHPFGMVTINTEIVKELRCVADNHQLELWEDCAETFTGLGDENYLGSSIHADIRFFSFGTIKTATALGGGVALLKNVDKAKHMCRLQQSLYNKQQTRVEFFRKIITAILLNSIADCPLRVGILSMLCNLCGLSFDTIVTYSVRGFYIPTMAGNSSNSKNLQEKREDDNRFIQSCLINQIRKRPSCALLAMLYRRLRQAKIVAPSVPSRLRRCKKVVSMLEVQLPNALFPDLVNFVDTFWAFPICCKNRDIVSRNMQFAGFDVATGASQLCSVSKFVDSSTNEQKQEICPSVDDLMNSILYLPICSQNLSDSKLDDLVQRLKDVLDSPYPDSSNIRQVLPAKSNTKIPKQWMFLVPIFISLIIIFGTWIRDFRLLKAFWNILQLLATGLVLRLGGQLLLRWMTAEFYLNESTAFAENCDMIDSIYDENKQRKSTMNSVINSMDSLSLSMYTESDVIESKRKVILTGATGFVGTAILRELLLNRDILSLDKVILICRKKGQISPNLRIERLMNEPIFEFLTEEEKISLIEVVEGDVTEKSAGLSSGVLTKLVQDTGISHVIHSAAAVSFTLEFPDAAKNNITSSLNMQDLAGRLKNKEVRFVHISTSFVHGSKLGSKEAPLPEELFDFQSFDPSEIYRSMIGTQYYASMAMLELGFPNTYSFSKSVCEHLLSHNNHLNTIIIRPSIVGPAVESPFEGWAGERPSTIVAGTCLHLINQWNIWHLGRQYATCFPVDLLARFVIVKAFNVGSDKNNTLNDGSSSSDGSFERISNASDELSECEVTGSRIVPQNMVECRFPRIFNATWNTKSSQNAFFSWVEFSIAYLQLGSVLGYFSRSCAMMQLFISAQTIPSLEPSIETFRLIQSLFIRLPFQLASNFNDYMGITNLKLTKFLTILDLPLLFYPFVKDEFYFQSELDAPNCFDAKRYSFTCGVAAHRFISTRRASKGELSNTSCNMKMSSFPVGGRNHSHGSSCLFWAFCQPRGDVFYRFAGASVAYLLRRISTVVTVDLISFRKHLAAIRSNIKNGPVHLVLVPTHRSFLDFILLSYVFFSVPELQVTHPYIVAANEFQYLPFIGWLAYRLRAFFIQRGKGKIDTNLSSRLEILKENNTDATFEVFIEGRRSRDRRFVDPKTGLLKSLMNSGGEHVILPITINYECIPEQNILSDEAAGSHRKGLSVRGMIFWLIDVFRGKVDIGKVHIVASDALKLDCKSDKDFRQLADAIQICQQKKLFVSQYHIKAACKLLDIEESVLEKALRKLGCQFWPATHISDLPELPIDQTTLWTILLQFGHIFAPLFFYKRRKWSIWLNRVCKSGIVESMKMEDDIQLLYDRLEAFFDSADTEVMNATSRLRNRGFTVPDSDHILQTAKAMKSSDIPLPIICAAVAMKLPNQKKKQSFRSTRNSSSIPNNTLSAGIEKLGFWGFNDSGFIARIDERGRRYVTMKGTRYALCGKRMTNILPFIESSLKIKISLSNEFTTMHPRWSSDVEGELAAIDKKYLNDLVDGQLSFSTLDRLRDGTGHSQEDIYALRHGDDIRIPDAVLWPSTEEQVKSLVNAAGIKGWCLIPCGGGTNVIEATRCPSKEIEPRPILSINMKRMNRVLLLNEEDGLAHVEAGITGRELVEVLDRRGYTMGHEPDSIEFSTLGGWIATKASGMKRSKYGNIEDIVVSTRIVNQSGVLWNGSSDQKIVMGRHSEGIDVRTLAFGSEGCLGIITSAVIRVWPLPEVRKYDSVMFPRFEDGLQFLKVLSREPRTMPACVRLLDNAHFRLGQALRPVEPSLFHRTKDVIMKTLMSMYFEKDFHPDSIVCATISYEGSNREVREQMARVLRLSRIHGGIMLGSKVGKAGYDLTYMIAYLRDFAMTYHILGESFETFVPWSKIETLIAATKARIVSEHASKLLPGVPFVGCRVTQLYHEGACLYFYMCINFEGFEDRASAIYADLERAARDEILKQGGSLSHHHGLGKLRSTFAKNRSSSEFRNVIASIKESIDKQNVFGARNGLFAS